MRSRLTRQKLLTYIIWLVAGAMLLGGIIDNFDSVRNFVSVPISVIGSIVLVLFSVTAYIYLRGHPLQWQDETGSVTHYGGLPAKIWLGVIGMILLLWIPHLIPNPASEPALYIFSKESTPDNSYLIRGMGWQDYEIGHELAVYDVRIKDAQIPIALMRVTGHTPDALKAQAVLTHESLTIEPNMRVDDQTAELNQSELLPSYPGAVGYLLEESRVRLRSDINLQPGNIIHVLDPVITDEATTLDYLATDLTMVILQIGGQQRVAEVELVEAGSDWPPAGSLLGIDPNNVCNQLDSEIQPASGDETLLVISTFTSSLAQPADLHTQIAANISQIIDERGFGDISVELDEVFQFQVDEREQAEAVGKCYNASILIWGQETADSVRVNFLNLRQPSAVAGKVTVNETKIVPRLASPEKYHSFVIEQVPNQMAYLALFAIGQLLADRQANNLAIPVMEEAIAQVAEDAQGLPDNFALSEAYFRLGEIYRTVEDLQLAIDNYNRAIALDNQHDEAYTNRGYAYYSQGDLERAFADFDHLVTFGESTSCITCAYINRGLVYHEQGYFEQAIDDFNTAITLDSTQDALAYNNRAYTYFLMGDLEQALADYNRAIAVNNQVAVYYNDRGRVYAEMGDLTKAIADYTYAISLDEQEVFAYNNRGNAYIDLGKLEQAIADYDRAIAIDDQHVNAYNGRGIAYFEQGNPQKAIIDFNHAISLDSQHADAYHNRGRVYLAEGNVDQAIADFTESIAFDNRDADAYTSRGTAYYVHGDLERAIDDYDTAIMLDNRNAPTFYKRGVAYDGLGDYKQAISDLSQAIALENQNDDYYNGRGQVYAAQGDMEKAISDFTSAISIDDQQAYAYTFRGKANAELGNLEQATLDFTKSIALDSQNASSYIDRGYAYELQGRLDMAIADYTEAIALNKKDSYAYYRRGLAYADQGAWEQAVIDYTQAIAQNNQYIDAFHYRGIAYAEQGNYLQAIDDYNQAIALGIGRNARVYNNRGNAYSSLGDNDKAIMDYNRAIEIDDQYAKAYYNRGKYYHVRGDLKQAVVDYTRAIKLDDQYAKAFYYRAVIYSDQGNLDLAVADLQNLLTISTLPAGMDRHQIEAIINELQVSLKDK